MIPGRGYFLRAFSKSETWPKRISAKVMVTMAMETVNIRAEIFAKFSTPYEEHVNSS